MSEPKRVKCKVDSDPGLCELCPTMARYAESGMSSGKGFKEGILMNFETGKRRWAYIAYKSGAKDQGVVLNFCPWCGETLRPAEASPA